MNLATTDPYKDTAKQIAQVMFVDAKDIEIIRNDLSESHSSEFTIYHKYRMIGEFSLVAFPGCCGIVISTGATVNYDYRELGIGTMLHKLRKKIAIDWGYSVMVCTDVEANIPQQKILTNNGWSKVLTFKNSRTGNNVCMHTIVLNAEPTDTTGIT